MNRIKDKISSIKQTKILIEYVLQIYVVVRVEHQVPLAILPLLVYSHAVLHIEFPNNIAYRLY